MALVGALPLSLEGFTPLPMFRFLEDAEIVEGFDFDCTPFVADVPATFGVFEETEDPQMVALDELNKLRGGNPEWYEEVITSMLVQSCEGTPENREDRYLPEEDEKADCDKSYSDSAPEAGYCEAKPNCYWAGEDDESGSGRATLYTQDQIDSNKKEMEDYAISVGKYMGAAIACAVLNFLGTLLYFCGRCICRCRCMGAKPRETPYHTCEILLPIFFFSFFAVGMVATGYQANHGNGKVTVAIDRTFDTVTHGATDMQYVAPFWLC